MGLGYIYQWFEHDANMGAKIQRDKTTGHLLDWLRQREDEIAALLADLIAVPTENPPGRHYREFAEVFGSRAEKLRLPSRADFAVPHRRR